MQAKRNGSASSSAGTNIDQTLLLKDFFNSQLSREQQQRQKSSPSSSSTQRDQKNVINIINKRSNRGNNQRSQHDRQSSSPSKKKNNNRKNDDLITFLIQKAASKQQRYQPSSLSSSSSTATIHEMNSSSNSSHGTTPDEQELFRKQRLAYIRELRSQVLPPQNLKSANQYSLVHSTVRFFEQNLSYFVEHPIEFQRLVSQLRTRQERTLFLQTVYMYYYPDVLHELRRLEMRSMTEQKQQQKQQKIRPKQNSKDNEHDDDVNEQKRNEQSVNLLMKQYRNEQQQQPLSEKELQEQEKKRTKKKKNTYDEEQTMPCSAQKQNIDLNKVKHVYRFIQNFDSSFAVSSVVELSNVACFEPFYRLILELNSSEALCLEAMLSVVNN